MIFQFDVAPFVAGPSDPPVSVTGAPQILDLLRQILEVQREHVAFLRATHDFSTRWRAFVARWREDFPDLPESCREALPILERSYLALLSELAEYLRQPGDGALDNDFSLQEFIDRYGMRLAQLGSILNVIAPLAELKSQGESS